MSSATAASSASAKGATLLSRCGDDSPSGAWQVAAASAGVAGAEAFLCYLSRSLIAALERLAAFSEAARARVCAARDAATVEAQSHCDDLESRIESTASSKRVALERELLAVDAALEQLREERSAVAGAVATLSDTELESRHAELTARLDAADTQLLALPTAVVEIAHVDVVVDEAALLAGAAVFGQVVAPRAITAADLTFERAPNHAFPGCNMTFRLVSQGAQHASQSEEEHEVSLGAAAAASHVESTLMAEGAAIQPLDARFCIDGPGRRVTFSISVPLDAPVGASVCFGPLTVSGQPVADLLAPLLVKPPGPADLSPELAAQLQAWLPPGGSPSPGAWEEVYRATAHGFGSGIFHEQCDGRARLLVLVRAQEGGWLFGGFTAVGFSPHNNYYADPSAFLFSLTNSLGCPEKLESRRMGKDLVYNASFAAVFGPFGDLCINGNADTESGSHTDPKWAYAAPASSGAHPMARGLHYFRASEIVAWVV